MATRKQWTDAEARYVADLFLKGLGPDEVSRLHDLRFPDTPRSAKACDVARWKHPILVDALGTSPTTRPSRVDPDDAAEDDVGPAPPEAVSEGFIGEREFTTEEIRRIRSLDDLVAFYGVDPDAWEVREFWITGNSWDQHSVKKGFVVLHQYKIKAHLVRRPESVLVDVTAERDRILEEMAAHAPRYEPVARRTSLGDGDPVVFEVAVFDPHIGMLAWGEEVGADYDTKIAIRDYAAAVEHLMSYALLYPTERILFVAGNDFFHVDALGENSRGGSTTKGTPQDVDTRQAKMFTAGRRALVAAVDRARTVAPVDVVMVPGNHDSQQTFRLGEVLNAWYRNDSEVTVHYGPARRKFYGYGKNAWMFTHGEEYKRQRDNLPLIFATECPPEIWTASTHREIHTGHNHIAMAGRYVPTGDLTETRAIRTRSLPGLTPEDAWHYEEGYRHRRTATALAFRRSGGIAGLHEFNL